MRDATPHLRLRRTVLLLATGLAVAGALGWLSGCETPAAQRAAERVEPYDPLK